MAVEAACLLELLGPIGPVAAQLDLAFVRKKVRGFSRADKHHVVVEVQEAIGQTLYAPQHGLDAVGIECGQ